MHVHNTPVKVGPVDTPNGTAYRYMVGEYLSQDTYTNAVSAWHDARKPQAIVKGSRYIVPASRLVRS